MNEANELMPKLLEIGMLNAHQLLMFKNVFQHVCDWIKQINEKINPVLTITNLLSLVIELPKIEFALVFVCISSISHQKCCCFPSSIATIAVNK